MYRVIRLSLYALIYLLMLGVSYLFQRYRGHRPALAKYLLMIAGLMFSAAIIEEFR